VSPTDSGQLSSFIDKFCSQPEVTVLADSTYNYQFSQPLDLSKPGTEDYAFIEWVSGCYLDGQTTQNVSYPIGPSGPDCNTILKNTYSQCKFQRSRGLTYGACSVLTWGLGNNGGIGGFINAGCLAYSWHPEPINNKK
jgi:hypothetical protein